jgi:hypothetical protein
MTPPAWLCDAAEDDLTRVIPQPLGGTPTAIYGFAPMSSGACAGDTWELITSMGEGWVCLAARVEDMIGNVGISPPIRVCIDDLVGASQCGGPPPECANCAPPPNFPRDMMLERR